MKQLKANMKVIISECFNQDKELQTTYQARICEVETSKKAHEALSTSYRFAKLTFQSELHVVKNEIEDWKKTCQELVDA